MRIIKACTKNCILLFSFLSTVSVCHGQASSECLNVDSIVKSMNLKGEHDPANLAWTLEEPFVTDSQKVRAIYFWITENIAYDVAQFARKTPDVPFDPARDENITQWQYRRIVHVLISKKAICEDYALLFQFMCKTLKIECELVTGYALVSRPTDFKKLILNEEASNHAWNAVNINGKWYLVDCTFAAGGVNPLTGRFERFRNERYYLSPPEVFILDHHPVYFAWQLLDRPLTIKEFIDNAKYCREEVVENGGL